MGLFVTDEERYEELENYYKIPFPDFRIKTFMEGNEDKVQFVKDNYSAIIDYLKKEYPDTIGSDVYYTNTQKVDNRKIVALATDTTWEGKAREGQHHFNDKEHFTSGLEWLADIGDNVTWSREKYIKNFPAILTYLEKHDGLNVAEVRDLYHKEVEEKRQNPTYKKWGEMKILEPEKSEGMLTELVMNAKKNEFAKNAEPGNSMEQQALKYFKVLALREVLKQQEQVLNIMDGRAKKTR